VLVPVEPELFELVMPLELWPLWPDEPYWLLPVVEPCWFEPYVEFELVSLEEPIVLLPFGFACAVPLTPDEFMLPLTPDEFMLPLAVAEPLSVVAVPLEVVPWFGLVAAVPAVACPPSMEPCCVVPVALAVLVSLFELEHAAINAAAAIAVPT